MTIPDPPGRLAPLPDDYGPTRESVHRLACYVLAPARKAASGRIGLQPTPGGFGTPVFGADEQLRIEGASLVRRRGHEVETVTITSIGDAAAFAGVALSENPGVGDDPPDLGDPDAALAISAGAVGAVGDWFAFSGSVLEAFRAQLIAAGRECSTVQLWPEHFDLACSIEGVNFGCSPGDASSAEPYVYVGPWNTDGLPGGDFWNAPFGALLPYKELVEATDQPGATLAFLQRGAGLALQRAGEMP